MAAKYFSCSATTAPSQWTASSPSQTVASGPFSPQQGILRRSAPADARRMKRAQRSEDEVCVLFVSVADILGSFSMKPQPEFAFGR